MTSNKLENNSLFGYKKLIAWQKANELAHKVYDLTLAFPRSELFGITSQLQRAVLSVPLNIVEGHARNNKKEFHRFLAISLGSLAETEYLLEFAYERKYIKEETFKEICLLRSEVGHIIWRLYISQKGG
ncbi:MAG: four helix bundle protein [Candidatus Daviesbacteria bacterium]|nr:four helix bundle protein [Candidatus Daviesbacteria bacterium]